MENRKNYRERQEHPCGLGLMVCLLGISQNALSKLRFQEKQSNSHQHSPQNALDWSKITYNYEVQLRIITNRIYFSVGYDKGKT